MEHMRSSWVYDKSWVSISVAGLRSRQRLAFAIQQKEIVNLSCCRWWVHEVSALPSSVKCCTVQTFSGWYQLLLFSPLPAVCFSVTISGTGEASALNQKQQRKKSFINSLNAPSTQKSISLIYISRNGFDKTAFAAKLKLS